jgi:hypothetical protein
LGSSRGHIFNMRLVEKSSILTFDFKIVWWYTARVSMNNPNLQSFVIKRVGNLYCLLIKGKFRDYTGWLFWNGCQEYRTALMHLKDFGYGQLYDDVAVSFYRQGRVFWNYHLNKYKDMKLD